MLAFTWLFKEHSKDLKSEVCLEGYDHFRPHRDLFTVILSRQSFVASILCVLTQIRKLQGGKFSLNVYLYC